MNDSVNIAFFGSPQLAAVCLSELVERFRIGMVVTKPDRERGRGKKVTPTPVKQVAGRKNIPVYQPVNIDRTLLHSLDQHNIHLIVVVAYGKILPRWIIDHPERGSMNLHASLLPKYRGPSPIQSVLLRGEKVTGITLQIMRPEMDAGEIVARREIPVEDEWTAEDLMNRIISVGPSFLVRSIGTYLKGTSSPEKQREEEVTYCAMIRKDDGLIDWSGNTNEIINKIRAFNIWPVAHTYLENKLLRIYNAHVSSLSIANETQPGMIVDLDKADGIVVCTGDGFLSITDLQLENKKRMHYRDFMNGYRNLSGKILVSTPL
jgi:methionyl-tRNA formyltransferase